MRIIHIHIFYGSRAFDAAPRLKGEVTYEKGLLAFGGDSFAVRRDFRRLRQRRIDPVNREQTFPALPAPQNLKAVVKPGAIVIGWDVVGDAAGYAVYRKDAETHVSKRVGDLGADQTHYQDKVGYSNQQLVDKRTYTYTAVAKGKTVGKDNLLLNGSASIDATANIPM